MFPGYDEYAEECRSAAVQECDNLMKSSPPEVAIEDCRANDGGKVEKDELYWNDDLS